jgi:hypothetical protein
MERGARKMKRKIITVALLGLLAVGSIVPLATKAMETWDYGYDKSGMYDYNYYITSEGSQHYGSITKNGLTWFGPSKPANQWSKFNLDYTGPYLVTYNKHIVY